MLYVKEFREARGLQGKQIVEVMREKYPKYDKTIHSKVERPEEYGIRLLCEAEKLIEEAFAGTVVQAKKRDGRRLPCRVQCRMSKARFERLQQTLREEGFETGQEGVSHILARYLDEKCEKNPRLS